MTKNTVYFPVAADDFTGFRAWYNAILENLISFTAHTTAPTDDQLYDYMAFIDTDASPKTFSIYDGSAWKAIFDIADNGGMVRHDGSQVMTGDLDMDGKDIILDGDGDTKIVCDTEDEISFELGGAEEFLLTATIADFKGNYIQNCAMNANTATPSGATAKQIEIKDSGGTTFYVPAYTAAWS